MYYSTRRIHPLLSSFFFQWGPFRTIRELQTECSVWGMCNRLLIDWLINSEKEKVSGSLPSVMGTGLDGTAYQTPKSTNGVNANGCGSI